MIFEEIGSDIPEKHLFCIENGAMLTDANLWQTHNQGYEPNYTFNYGFVNVGSNDIVNKRWLPLKGNIIEYWYLPADEIGCVELRANDNSYGIRQRLMDFATREYLDDLEIAGNAEGFYLITWKDRARLGDNGSEVGNAYSAYVTIGDPEESTQTIENKINDKTLVELASVDIANDALSQSQWRNRGMIVRVKRADEFNSQSAHIWLSFKNTNNSTFGTLITDVDVHPLTLTSDGHEIFPYEDTNDENLGYVDKRNTNCIAWIQARTADNNAPAMPNLTFGSLPDSGYKIKANLNVSYDRPAVLKKIGNKISSFTNDQIKAARKNDTVNIPKYNTQRECYGSWTIFNDEDWISEVNNGFFGGDAELSFSIYSINSGAENLIGSDVYKFRIAGQNPTDTDFVQFVHDYSTSESKANTLGKMSWYIPALFRHECKGFNYEASSYYPFELIHTRDECYFNQFRDSGNEKKWVKGSEGIPTHSSDPVGAGGYGIGQITGSINDKYYAIERNLIWNWRANVEKAFELLESKYIECRNYMNKQKEKASKVLPEYTITTTTIEGDTTTFIIKEDGDKNMASLCALKYYNGCPRIEKDIDVRPDTSDFKFTNGAGKPYHYCGWKETNKTTKEGYWYINRFRNFPPRDYVEAVLLCISNIDIAENNDTESN